MATMGISSLGVLFGYASGSTMPKAKGAFKQLTRISSIGEIALDTETIDVSALEDFVNCYVEGRADTGGTCDVTVNMTNDTIAEWEDVIAAYDTAVKANEELYFTVYHPKLSKAFYFTAGVPNKLNMPAQDQNVAETMTITLVVHEYIGLDDANEPVANTP